MIELTFQEVVAAASKLSPAQKAALVQMLQSQGVMSPTREELIAETERLRASGAFERAESLRNKYASAAAADLTEDELKATLRESAVTWEQELDERFTKED